MMRIAMSTNNFGGEGIESIIGVAQKLDIHFLELWPSNLETAGEPEHMYSYVNRDWEKAYQQLKQAGIRVGCLSSGIGLTKEWIDDRNKFSRELIHAIEIAHRVGAECLLHYGLALLDSDTPDFDQLRFFWQDAIDAAEQYGITMVLENEPFDYTWTPDNMKRVIDAFHCGTFKTNFDATNYFHSSAEAFPWGYEVLRDDIGYVHVKNGTIYRPEFCREACWIGESMTHRYEGERIYYTEADAGVVNNHALLKRLAADGYTGFCTPEPQHTTHENALSMLSRDVAYLRSTGYFE